MASNLVNAKSAPAETEAPRKPDAQSPHGSRRKPRSPDQQKSRRNSNSQSDQGPRRNPDPQAQSGPRKDPRPQSNQGSRRNPDPQTGQEPRKNPRPQSNQSPRRNPDPQSDQGPRKDPRPPSNQNPGRQSDSRSNRGGDRSRGSRSHSNGGGESDRNRERKPAAAPVPFTDAEKDIRRQILELVATQPLDKIDISKQLDLAPSFRRRLRELLDEMENAGEIVRIRKDRYIVPSEADLFTGTIQFHASGAAHVLNEEAGGADLYISSENSWTAMHGDRVVARINSDRASADRRPPAASAKREGRVIRILKRANDTIVGTLQKSKNFWIVAADDPRFVHNLYVPAPAPELRAHEGDKVVAKMDEWTSRHVNPEGHVIEVLGRAGAPGVDILSIIRKYHLPQEFPSEVTHEAEHILPTVPEEEAARRNDLRSHFIITIDPDDAKDFDDAIEVQRTKDGWTVAVHIADVSHYVQPRTALDREAVSRGNSVYLADRVIPMLPEALSNGICSLKPGVDRLAFSCFAEVTRQGKVHGVHFGKSIICSAARLTYKEAFAILQKPPVDEVSQRVHTAWELSSLLRKKRFEQGSLELDFPEVKVWLDADGRPVRLERVENDASHQLIEELMLLANECVARELKLAKQPTVYRIHENPDPDKLAEYRQIAQTYGLKAGDLTVRANLVKLLASTKGLAFENALKIGLLKSLKRATYSPEPLGHYGLAKPDYTHFTSPIRRYADLIVHRSLERQLGLTKVGPASNELAATAEYISGTERTASDAERESTRLKKLEFFQQQISSRKGEAFPARILEVRNYGLLVELPEFLLQGLIHVSMLDDDFYVHDAAKGRFVGRKTRRTYEGGQTIEVIVAKVDMFKQQVDFRPA